MQELPVANAGGLYGHYTHNSGRFAASCLFRRGYMEGRAGDIINGRQVVDRQGYAGDQQSRSPGWTPGHSTVGQYKTRTVGFPFLGSEDNQPTVEDLQKGVVLLRISFDPLWRSPRVTPNVISTS